MDTSRFANLAVGTACVLVFSGRRDPAWHLSAAELTGLSEALGRLKPLAVAHPEPPPLGYRGCIVRLSDERTCWAFQGNVVMNDGTTRSQLSDPERLWERQVIALAPSELIDPALRSLLP